MRNKSLTYYWRPRADFVKKDLTIWWQFGHTFLRSMRNKSLTYYWRPRAKNFKKSKFLGFFQIFLKNKKIRKFAFLRIFGF